jgi:hypothetical protein
MFGDSTETFEYTYAFSKLSCYKPFYAAHLTFAYLVFISGILALITRIHPSLYLLHSWCGRAYILSMLWATATSLLIHNTGLPIGVLYSFVWVMCGLSVGWLAISIHQKTKMFRMKLLPTDSLFVKAMKRMVSLKALHGCLMVVSWTNIAGRVFVTPATDDFKCHTQPAEKPISGAAVELVPTNDPNYEKFPWANNEIGWLFQMFFAPFVLAVVIGLFFAWFELRKEDRKAANLLVDDADETSNEPEVVISKSPVLQVQ